MLKCQSKLTGMKTNCVYWDGNNKIELIQFGKREGKRDLVSVDCKGNAYVCTPEGRRKIITDSFLMLTKSATNIVVLTKEQFHNVYELI